MDNKNKKKAVFTDLDGTLLDYFTYSYKKSRKGIDLLQKKNIPLILVSSKTINEMIPLHKELSLHWPFIFENGGGLAYPLNNEGYKDLRLDILGEDTKKLMEKMIFVRDAIERPIKTLAEMSIEEISARTNLSEENAGLAARRMTSIPFVLLDEDELELKEINDKLRERKVHITKGARFYHLSSLKADKGYAVRVVIQYLMISMKIDKIESIAVGDSENDIPMLKVVDNAFLVRRHDGSVIDTGFDVNITKGIGPAGFSQAIKSII